MGAKIDILEKLQQPDILCIIFKPSPGVFDFYDFWRPSWIFGGHIGFFQQNLPENWQISVKFISVTIIIS